MKYPVSLNGESDKESFFSIKEIIKLSKNHKVTILDDFVFNLDDEEFPENLIVKGNVTFNGDCEKITSLKNLKCFILDCDHIINLKEISNCNIHKAYFAKKEELLIKNSMILTLDVSGSKNISIMNSIVGKMIYVNSAFSLINKETKIHNKKYPLIDRTDNSNPIVADKNHHIEIYKKFNIHYINKKYENL